MVAPIGALEREWLSYVEKVFGGRESMAAEQFDDLQGAFMAGAVSTLVAYHNGASVKQIKQELLDYSMSQKAKAASMLNADGDDL